MRILPAVTAAAVLFAAGAASAGVYKIEVTVVSDAGAAFSAPVFSFTNSSSAGVQVSSVSASGPPWDFVFLGAPGSIYQILDPTGGARQITSGTESSSDENNGGPTTISYNLSGFDPGEFFRFAPDPEASNGSSAVVDVRPFLNSGFISASASFVGGPTLQGSNWVQELIDPTASASADFNQRYRLTLEQAFADPSAPVPEPGTWALMIAGFGGAGLALRARKAKRVSLEAAS